MPQVMPQVMKERRWTRGVFRAVVTIAVWLAAVWLAAGP